MLKNALIQNGFSNREIDVAELVVQGLRNKEIGEKLFVTEKTVKYHTTNIYKKANVKSRTRFIAWCIPHMKLENESSDNIE